MPGAAWEMWALWMKSQVQFCLLQKTEEDRKKSEKSLREVFGFSAKPPPRLECHGWEGEGVGSSIGRRSASFSPSSLLVPT